MPKQDEEAIEIEMGSEQEKANLISEKDKNVSTAVKHPVLPSTFKTAFFIVGNVASSVSLIMVNKMIMETHGFSYVIVLTALHFAFTAILFGALTALNVIETKELPLWPCLYTSLTNVGSIVFMNFSLHTNSVGFYQITKLVCIPVMVFIETFFYGKTFSLQVKISLLTLIIGVAIVTVTDVKLNLLGVVYGVLAIACTSMSQIALGDNQKAHNLSSLQMLENIIAPQALITVLFAIPIEMIPQMDGIVFALRNTTTLGLVILSCIISISVNFFTIALISATSAVTYQVVGHTKTCLILLLGFILFPINMPSSTFLKNIGGIVVAVVGVVAYGHFKSRG
jgi:solute carrier family 35 protein E3